MRLKPQTANRKPTTPLFFKLVLVCADSASASIMAMAIAIAVGIREQSILASIFILHFVTMMFGLLTEYVSVPRSTLDRTTYTLPVGAQQFREWQRFYEADDETRTPRFRVDYHRDRHALKLISQDAWEGDRPYADIEEWKALDERGGEGAHVARRANYYVEAQRCLNYIRRMFPHALGYFPMSAAWVIIIVHLETAKRDLTYITDRTVPEWVNGAVSRMPIFPHTHTTTLYDLLVLCCADLRHGHHLLVVCRSANYLRTYACSLLKPNTGLAVHMKG